MNLITCFNVINLDISTKKKEKQALTILAVQSGIVPQVCFLGTCIDTEEQLHKGDDVQDERFP